MKHRKEESLMESIMKVKAASDLDSLARDTAELKRIEKERLERDERERGRREQRELDESRRRDEALAEEERQTKLARIELIRKKGLGIHLEQLKDVEDLALQKSLTMEEAAQQFRQTLLKNECGYLLPDDTCPVEQTKGALMEKYALSLADFGLVESEHLLLYRPFAMAVEGWRKSVAEADVNALQRGSEEIKKAARELDRAEAIGQKVGSPKQFEVQRVRQALTVLRIVPSRIVLVAIFTCAICGLWMLGGLSFTSSLKIGFFGVSFLLMCVIGYARLKLSKTCFALSNFSGLSSMKGPPGHLMSIYGVLERVGRHLPRGQTDETFEAAFWKAFTEEAEALLVVLREANPSTLRTVGRAVDCFSPQNTLGGMSPAEALIVEGHVARVAHLIVSDSRFQSLRAEAVFRLGWLGIAARERLGRGFDDVAGVSESVLLDLQYEAARMTTAQDLAEIEIETDKARLVALEVSDRVAPGTVSAAEITELRRKIASAGSTKHGGAIKDCQKFVKFLGGPKSFLDASRRSMRGAA